MARSQTNEIRVPPGGAPVMALPYTKEPELCKTCSGWRPLQTDTTLGHCIPSMKAMPSAIITMDRQSCGKWDAEKWKVPKP